MLYYFTLGKCANLWKREQIISCLELGEKAKWRDCLMGMGFLFDLKVFWN